MTREKALKIVKEFINGTCLHLVDQEALETLIPELAESEDERIRKALIDIVKRETGFTGFPSQGQVLAYLEKQKDLDKMIVVSPEVWDNAITDAYENGKKDSEKQKEQKSILEVFGFKVGDAVRLKDGDGRKHIIKSFEEVEGVHGPNFYHVEFEDNSARDGIYPGEEYPNGYYTQMEKFEEEQKPMGWSEEDKEMLQSIIKDFRAGKVSTIGQEQWLKSLPERFNLQPKQEWSEKDDLHLTNAILSAEKEWGKNSCTAKWLNDLPNRFFPRQKQEWSEEDEEKLKAICTYLQDYPRLAKLGDKLRFNKYCDFLKSLKPQPKQEWSEEDEKTISDACCWIAEYAGYLMDKNYGKASMLMGLTEKLKSLRPQHREEIYQAAKHDLAIKFMNYLDENRPEEKMSLSNAECEDIDNAFKENDWAKIMRYVDKYRPSWKPNEEQMEALKDAVRLFKETHFEKFHYKIESLYEQLLKLGMKDEKI